MNQKFIVQWIAILFAAFVTVTAHAADSPTPGSCAAGKKPNILVIWGDHMGWANMNRPLKEGTHSYNIAVGEKT